MSTPNPPQTALTLEEVQAVSPALAKYTEDTIAGDLWERPELSPRDRGIVTVAALVARNQTIGMVHYFNVALDRGVNPSEISEIITHLAFYSGWSNAFTAVAIVKDIFVQRGIGPDQLPAASPDLLPLNEGPRASAQLPSSGTSDRRLLAWSSTRPMFCFVTSGCALAYRPGTAAW